MDKEERDKKIREKIEEEEQLEQVRLEGVKEWVWDILLNVKHFRPEEIQIDPHFNLEMSDCEAIASIDYVINLNSTTVMAIKCSSSALESWERYIKALARVVLDYQIPYAMVTDGETVRVFDIVSGSVVSNSVQELFSREEALKRIEGFEKTPFPKEKSEREKRIVYAFEGIKCPISGGKS
ncbi:MAG TPA: type I restriction enzyme HsdR N-terminal domain-containing protein [Thermodesulfovibrionales bacterium]|nr:type I restriction enzyme HsdR N-terminal domain-containing protein [Thermodesulfovibrionales bacterium]